VAERTTARELLRERTTTLREDSTLREALMAMLAERGDRDAVCTFPVVAPDGSLRGLLPAHHLLKALAAPLSSAIGSRGPDGLLLRAGSRLADRVGDVMLRDVPVAHPDDGLLRLMDLTAGHGLECVPVVEGGRVVGIVRLADVFGLAADLALAPGTGNPESRQT
jgi:CBS domain-containing protein